MSITLSDVNVTERETRTRLPLGAATPVVRPGQAELALSGVRLAAIVALTPILAPTLSTDPTARWAASALVAGAFAHVAVVCRRLRRPTTRGPRAGLLVDLLVLAALFSATGGTESPLVAFGWMWAAAGLLLLPAPLGYGYVVVVVTTAVVTTPSLGLLNVAVPATGRWTALSGSVAVLAGAGLAVYVLRRSRADLLVAAMRDSLTGLLNRRAFDARIAELCGAGAHSRPPFSVAIADLDHFKNLNDTYGHQVGDEALQLFAQLVQGLLRPQDEMYRIGGEEFAVVFPATSAEDAAGVMHRARAVVYDGSAGMLTFSAGVAAGADTGIVCRADAAMYGAKRGGRNTVHLAKAIEPVPGACR